MLNERDEILIQRCVDDEATAEERREVVERFAENPDGWKSLACAFMEEQLFAGAVLNDEVRAAKVAGRQPAPVSDRHWFHHPMMSLALSVCVAFMAGLLVRGQVSDNRPVHAPLADTSVEDISTLASRAGGLGGSVAVPDAAAGFVADDGAYKVRLMENGQPSGELPVYSLKDYVRQASDLWQSSEQFGSGSPNERPYRVRTIWLSAPDGRIYIIPVEEYSSPWFQ